MEAIDKRYLRWSVYHPEDMGGSLNKKIDEAITQIDNTIEKLLIKREELLKMKSELE